ncbi:MAG TPA: VOC family protein [Myxococcaceae bacterium]|nr:VOC family protein [Myxococcaceae bacterium]
MRAGGSQDERPLLWVGHVVWRVKNVRAAAVFWRDLGMRQVHIEDGIGILELRGGTHLILLPREAEAPSDAPLDLMVDDLAETHAVWSARGLRVSPIERGRIHDTFTVTDPEGHAVTVNSSHVMGKV